MYRQLYHLQLQDSNITQGMFGRCIKILKKCISQWNDNYTDLKRKVVHLTDNAKNAQKFDGRHFSNKENLQN